MFLRLAGAALFVPLCSALVSPAVPVSVRVALSLFWLTAIVRPHVALVALVLLVPFSSWLLAIANAPPIHLAEAMVLAAVSGGVMAAGAAGHRPTNALRPQRPGLWPAGLLFAAIVVASAAVGLAVTQTGTRTPWPFLRSAAVFFSRDYLVGPPGEFVGVADAALLLEGVALVFVVSRHARDGVMRPLQVLVAFVVGAALAAMLTIGRLVVTAASAESLGGLVRGLLASRTSVHVGDVNAAGSYFTMAALVALALAFARPASLPPLQSAATDAWSKRANRWKTVSALLFACVWISGSRTAIVTALGAVVIGLVAAGPLRPGRWPRWAVVTGGVGAALLLGALVLGIDPRPSAARGASNMINMRAAFMLTGVRMIASAPVFGVGIGQYLDMSGQFMPPSIYWFYFHENAHNNFLQVAGELGLVGLAAFLCFLGAAARRLWNGISASPHDRWLAGTFAAVAAFAVTWLTSHPMLVHEVAYPFWIVLGAGIARADGDAQPPLVPNGRAPAAVAKISRATVIAVAIAATALAVSIPFRAARASAALDVARQSFGFYQWEEDAGVRFRWTSRRATFFVPSTARELRLPLRSLYIGPKRGPTEVSIAIGGRTLDRVVLNNDEWRVVRLRLPRDTSKSEYQRIDIITSPTWSRAAIFGERTDVRIMGVQVGEPSWM